MNYQTWIALVKMMKSVWTADNFLPDEYATKTWYHALKDIPAEQIKASIEKLIVTSKWPPTVAEIRENAAELRMDDTDWGEEWNTVIKAIGKYGYMQGKEALESFKPTTREAVKRLGWKQICESQLDEQTALRANFRIIYESLRVRQKQDAQMPEELRVKIGEMKKQIELAEMEKMLP